MSVLVPADRTSAQPALARCSNPKCRTPSGALEFAVGADGTVRCPACGSSSPEMVTIVVLVHVLVPDDNGPITGMHGRKWKLACDADRAYLATVTNLEAATVLPEAANCPGCLAAHAAMPPSLVT